MNTGSQKHVSKINTEKKVIATYMLDMIIELQGIHALQVV